MEVGLKQLQEGPEVLLSLLASRASHLPPCSQAPRSVVIVEAPFPSGSPLGKEEVPFFSLGKGASRSEVIGGRQGHTVFQVHHPPLLYEH